MLDSIALPPAPPRPLAEAFGGSSPDASALIEATFYFNPHLRVSAEDALAHPFLRDFHNTDEEPTYPHGESHCRPIEIAIDDNTKLSASDYRERLYREISQKKKESRRKEQSRARADGGDDAAGDGEVQQ